MNVFMSKPRGNVNWGKPASYKLEVVASSFESEVKLLGLKPEQYADSLNLKEWVYKNKDHKYVPLELLQLWGFSVKNVI